MKILFIYKYDHAYNVDFWLHENFMQACNSIDGIEAFVYGPRMHEVKENRCPLHFSRLHRIETLEEIFKPDVIICNTKSRMFGYYSPPCRGNKAEDLLLPKGFKESKTPKVILEEDYHYEDNDDWYHYMGFRLIMQRHRSQSLRQGKVKTEWLPFSVDLNSFNTSHNLERIRKLAFAGSMSDAYPDRIEATKKLKEHHLIDVFASREKTGLNYVRCLQEYIAHLNGCSAYDITAAKVFEITASGSLLFTNQFTGLEELYSKDSYVLWNQDNVVEQAKMVLNDLDRTKEIAYNGYRETVEKHSHSVRIRQMIKMLKENI